MDTTMYDKLLRLPLFQGLSRSDLTDILGKIKVELRKYDKKEYLAKQGSRCTELIYILDGRIKASSKDSVHNFTLSEILGGNTIIEPYSLFGMYTSYQFSYRAECETDVVIIKKEYILSFLCKYEIFNLNYLNVLSSRAQNMRLKLWNTHIGNATEKIVNFLLLRCAFPHGTKELHIRMEDLASLIDETRINVSKSLNTLKEKELISLSRRTIKVFNLNHLYLYITNQEIPVPADDDSELTEETEANENALNETVTEGTEANETADEKVEERTETNEAADETVTEETQTNETVLNESVKNEKIIE